MALHMKVFFKKLHPDARIPKYQTSGSSGFDFHTIEEVIIYPRQTVLVRTGLAVKIPDHSEMQIRAKSGQAFDRNDFILKVGVGTLDFDYAGEIRIPIHHLGHDVIPMVFSKGERIAQGIIVPIYRCEIEETDYLEPTERGCGGFGSTGKF